ncbi:hypothetical protein LTR66_017708 [Elasticomyces elasticus]|nr:hypothetical protein LTR66_017708 [Elasticomyces elasticus]
MPELEHRKINVHTTSFDLEAWTILALRTSKTVLHVFSGGDDSKLIASELQLKSSQTHAEVDIHNLQPRVVFRDMRTHSAGIISITSLGQPPDHPTGALSDGVGLENSLPFIILTGSYDEHLRLFHFFPAQGTQPMGKLELHSELKTPGGVWRIQALDADSTDKPISRGKEWLLLIANHTGGAHIVRVVLSLTQPGANDIAKWHYNMTVEASFTAGHESLVYAAAARYEEFDSGYYKGWHDSSKVKRWDVVSTSFYDKKICNWSWIDRARSNESATRDMEARLEAEQSNTTDPVD